MNTTDRVRFIAKPAVFVLCLLPALWLVTDAIGVTGSLGANPVEAIQDHFGQWALRFVLITLTISPLRHITGKTWVLRFRRMIGLFAFFYAFMHFLTWLLLDQGLFLSAIAEDIVKRPFITLGFLAVLLLLALAVTSPNAVRRRMGRRWQQLHYSVYAVALLGVWHYWWQVKQDVREPLLYAVILVVLLGFRLWRRIRT